ncbi:phosphohistidine phosphatase SixA [filamentous cyanobacterium CCP1]|nr:phosphohistidine phosphatase SixA [filamentous cyanobacterium CCP2]PSB61907.1 phosphohistidine phosphatase SixA [filamentous cyanobacterium CCP1]
MELYLIRHGLAAERGTYAHDDERPLTDAGLRKTKRVAKRLHELNLQFDLILTSPLVRARQTAEILQTVGLVKQVEESAYLAPGGAFEAWLNWLEQWRSGGGNSLAIVGHEPDLGEWAERLIWGEPRHNLVVKKAGIIGIYLPAQGTPVGRSELFWFTPPRLLLND